MDGLLRPTYNFLDLLPSEDSSVELFCFGTYADYLKYKPNYDTITRSTELLTKLIKLTILTIIQDNEGQTLPVTSILRQYSLDTAAEDLASKTGQSKNFVIEDLLISMIDEKSVEVHIDDDIEAWHLQAAHALRDSYDSKVHKLIVLREDGITKRSLENATKNIRGWQQDRLIPTGTSLQRGLSSPNTRKRKIPDNSS